MALAVYMAPTTITTSLPSPLAQTRMVDETLAYYFASEIPYGQLMFELTWITNKADKLFELLKLKKTHIFRPVSLTVLSCSSPNLQKD